MAKCRYWKLKFYLKRGLERLISLQKGTYNKKERQREQWWPWEGFLEGILVDAIFHEQRRRVPGSDQLTARSLPILEVQGSNPVIGTATLIEQIYR